MLTVTIAPLLAFDYQQLEAVDVRYRLAEQKCPLPVNATTCAADRIDSVPSKWMGLMSAWSAAFAALAVLTATGTRISLVALEVSTLPLWSNN